MNKINQSINQVYNYIHAYRVNFGFNIVFTIFTYINSNNDVHISTSKRFIYNQFQDIPPYHIIIIMFKFLHKINKEFTLKNK